MKTTAIRFQIHKARTDKNGLCPIKVIYELSDRVNRTTIPTGKKVRPENWRGGEAVFLTRLEAKKYPTINCNDLLLKNEVEDFNTALRQIAQEIRGIEENFAFAGKDYTIYEVVEEYKKRQNKKPQVVEAAPKIFIADYIESYIQKATGIINAGTLKTYGSLLKMLKKYGKNKENRLTFAELTKSKLTGLLKYYIEQGCNNSYTTKHFSILKLLIKEAISEGTQVDSSFRDFKPKILKNEEADVIVLSENEFNDLLSLDLSDSNKTHKYIKDVKGEKIEQTVSFATLEKVRNLFIFSSASGFRYSDLMDLKKEHIQNGWIRKKQVKGNKTHKIELPLNNLSKYILSLYDELSTPLPKISNQKANEYLKQVGKLAGIDTPTEKTIKTGTEIITKLHPKHELMTMHMGRRVFASLSLAKGIHIQNVMAMTGHKKITTFRRYMKIDEKSKLESMQAWNTPLKAVR